MEAFLHLLVIAEGAEIHQSAAHGIVNGVAARGLEIDIGVSTCRRGRQQHRGLHQLQVHVDFLMRSKIRFD